MGANGGEGQGGVSRVIGGEAAGWGFLGDRGGER